MSNVYIEYDKYRDVYDQASYLAQEMRSIYPVQISYANAVLQQLASADDQVRQAPAPFLDLISNVLTELQQLEESSKIDQQLAAVRTSCAQLTRELNQLTGQTTDIYWGTPVEKLETYPNYIRNVSKVIVDEPQQNKGKMHDYIDYRIIFKCETSSSLREDARYYMVRRRFNDLKALFEALKQCVVPPPELPPQKHFLMGGSDEEFIEDRRQKIAAWLSAVAAVPDLVQVQAFQKFALDDGYWRFVQQGYD